MDPAIENDELLAQRDFLRRLARGLLGDEGLAEDVVQEAELRALEHRPAGNLRAWLATVVRHLALNARRGRERRAAHERAAAREEAVAGHDEVLEGLDLQRSVLEAVRALDEGQRTALWLRYYEDRSPSEIAARLEVPVATVKTRLRRALQALRERLDAEHGGERRAWAAALVPLARAGSGGVVVDAGLTLGVLAMKKVVAGFALCVLVWLGWRVWSAQPEPNVAARTGQPTVELVVPEQPVEPADIVNDLAGRVEASTASEGTHEAAQAAATLAVHVVHERDGADASGVGLMLWPEDDALAELHAFELETDDSGRARFEGVPPGRYSVNTDRDGETPLELAAGEERTLELVLPVGFDVVGMVLDGAGQPVAGAEVWLEGEGHGTLAGRVVAYTDARGGFRLRSLDPQQKLGAFAPGFAPAFLELLRSKALAQGESELSVTLVLDREGQELRGRVLDPAGQPVPGARVALGATGNVVSGGRANGREGWRPKARMLVTDEGGAFRAGWIEHGQRAEFAGTRVHVLAPELALARVEGDDSAGELLVRLESGGTIEGEVRDAEGQLVAGATVAVERAGALVVNESPFALPSARSGADGSYRLAHVPGGAVELVLSLESDPRRGARETRVLADGESVRWDLVLGAARVITGRVLDEEGNGIGGRDVIVGNGRRMSIVSCDAGGAFVFEKDVAGSSWDFTLMGPGGVQDRVDAVAVGAEIVLVAREHQASIHGGFSDRAERALAGEDVVASLESEAAMQMKFQAELGAQGEFAFEHVPPGRYQITIASGGVALARSPWFEVAEGQSVDLAWLVSSEPGSLVLECALPAGVPLDAVRASLDELDATHTYVLEPCGERLCVADLAPGRYWLRVRGPGLALVQEEVEILAGAETRRAVALVRGVQRKLVFVAAPGVRVNRLELALRETTSGRTLVQVYRNAFADEPLELRFGLAPGHYALEATTDGGLGAVGALEIADLATPNAELTFELR